MSKQPGYNCELAPDNYYHIYNRANGKEKLFLSDRNNHHFLNTYSLYLHNLLETYAYCLIPNHFHFLVRVRSEDHILNLANSQYDKFLKNIISKILKDKLNIFDLISEVFRRFFIAYTKAFNIEQKRNGNLFQRPFKRILIDSDEYYSQLIYYIHANPENHGIIKDYKEYKWSSFQSILSVIPTKLERGSVLEWYGGKEGFIKFHSMYQKLENLDDFIIEDKNDFFEMKKR